MTAISIVMRMADFPRTLQGDHIDRNDEQDYIRLVHAYSVLCIWRDC